MGDVSLSSVVAAEYGTPLLRMLWKNQLEDARKFSP